MFIQPQKHTMKLISALTLCTLVTTITSVQAQSVPPNKVLIQGDTASVTVRDFEMEKKNIPPEQRLQVLTNENRVKGILERIFMTKTLIADAERQKFTELPEVAAELEYARNIKLASLYLTHLTKNIPLPDLEPAARERYKLNQAKYVTSERVKASHILVSTKSRSKEEARKLASDLRQRALNGEDFAELAKKYSEDPSVKRNGGDLGFFEADTMVKPFSAAAFAMTKPGEISDLVETEYGIHIIKYTERSPKTTIPFENVRADIEADLANDYRAAQVRRKMDELIRNQNAKPDEDAVQAVIDKPGAEQMRKLEQQIREELRPKSGQAKQ